MEGSEKDAARSKWRSTQKHRRGRGRGRGYPGGKQTSSASGLDGNYDRYEDEPVETAGPDGQPVKQSQGHDLAALLEATDAFSVDAFTRYREAIELDGDIRQHW
ncbi:hypothetical protein WJX72_007107 [[Myrmecia] bisecta]|uniref:Uncharacterized protein n=1 Tax=[Myrmecia] bisecta TaxID=41462 RepID=A0AAW1QS14_9CHLO